MKTFHDIRVSDKLSNNVTWFNLIVCCYTYPIISDHLIQNMFDQIRILHWKYLLFIKQNSS